MVGRKGFGWFGGSWGLFGLICLFSDFLLKSCFVGVFSALCWRSACEGFFYADLE